VVRGATISPVNKPPRTTGRPPGPHDDTLAKVLPTALRLFLDEGGPALTPTRLHQETGVARATIYRNWPDPADLVEVMLEEAAEPALATSGPPTGDVGADLASAMDAVVDRFRSGTARAFFAACIEYGRRSDRVATAAASFIASVLEPIHAAVGRAIDTGHLVGDVDELVTELAGPVVLENVLLGQPVDPARGRRVVEHVVAHHRPPGRRSRARAQLSA
jgi:AcrR family transcriptional regulator